MNTPKRLPLTCPSCETSLKVSELFCHTCGTKVCGEYDLPPLARLSEKEQQFAIDFIKSSGSLKEMARSMGLSYPTVRNILDELIEKLQHLSPSNP